MSQSSSIVVSHWYHLLENFNTSPMDFYNSIDRAIQARQPPGIRLSRVDWRESGLTSAKREYLRVSRHRLTFDVCGAPFGTGFFVSWWLVETTPSPAAAILIAITGTLMLLYMFGFFLGIILALTALLGMMALSGVLASQGGPAWADSVLQIPIIGVLTERLFKPDTYYRIDTTLMFQQAIHAAVLEAVDEITTTKGVRALSESERKPVMREFFRR